ncbi:MAG TPA: M23 family metallopeptidase [Actinomycetota bacterium]|nr:M23 family metallopeptidase [Actinomycetota bacterium]
MRRARLAIAGALVALVAGGSSAPAAAPRPEPPAWARASRPAWYRPVVVDGSTFPLARSSWLSYVQFRNDWHDPRYRLVDGRWRLVGYHEGVDLVAEEGTPVVAATGGTVEAVGWTFYSGTRVGLRGGDGRYYLYAHLSGVAPGVAVGAPVAVGDVLGFVGNTGYGPPGHEDEFPPHLHFGIQASGGWVNPYPMVASLYRRSVAATAAGERELDRVARLERRSAYERLVARLYLGQE